MKKFTVIFVLLTISILMFMFPLGSNAASVESFVPTFLPAISGVNNIDFNLTADLDEDDPLLNTTIPVHSDTNNIIKLTLPVYAAQIRRQQFIKLIRITVARYGLSSSFQSAGYVL